MVAQDPAQVPSAVEQLERLETAQRLALEREGLLKVQARALMEAAAGRTLNVMFPMVSEPWEYEAARNLFVGQRAWLAKHNKKLPVAIRYGAMLEVPGLLETLDLMLPHLDFLSVGTNDLTQFLFAADRAHPRLAERYAWLSPIVIRYLARALRTVSGSKDALGRYGNFGKPGTVRDFYFWIKGSWVFMEFAAITAGTVALRLRELSFLNKGLVIRFTDERSEPPRDETFRYDGGIKAFGLQHRVAALRSTPASGRPEN